ncbi:putative immunity protein [Arthrobacter sp. ISL-28]|uniref:putative immunity protein n=1 Tax=Arthrobacter sp. ISL-28 TaxID=2819108 RepID=UPI0037C01142
MSHCASRRVDRSASRVYGTDVASPQTLSEAERRVVATWAADCAERVVALFEAEAPADGRPRYAIARARAFARGELSAAEEIRRRFVAGRAARDVNSPAAVAAARSATQAAAVAHMGAHALGAAAYAAKAAGLAAPDRLQTVDDEIHWQLEHMSAGARSALRRLPPLGGIPPVRWGQDFSRPESSPRSSARSRPTWLALTSLPPPAESAARKPVLERTPLQHACPSGAPTACCPSRTPRSWNAASEEFRKSDDWESPET